jgi:hypothetical protein
VHLHLWDDTYLTGVAVGNGKWIFIDRVGANISISMRWVDYGFCRQPGRKVKKQRIKPRQNVKLKTFHAKFL